MYEICIYFESHILFFTLQIITWFLNNILLTKKYIIKQYLCDKIRFTAFNWKILWQI